MMGRTCASEAPSRCLAAAAATSLRCRYVKFDTFHPAVDAGLPVTRVISRVTLQEVLAKTVLK